MPTPSSYYTHSDAWISSRSPWLSGCGCGCGSLSKSKSKSKSKNMFSSSGFSSCKFHANFPSRQAGR